MNMSMNSRDGSSTRTTGGAKLGYTSTGLFAANIFPNTSPRRSINIGQGHENRD